MIKPATIDFLDLGALPASDLKELKREADSSSDPIIIPKGGIVFGNGIVSTSYVSAVFNLLHVLWPSIYQAIEHVDDYKNYRVNHVSSKLITVHALGLGRFF